MSNQIQDSSFEKLILLIRNIHHPNSISLFGVVDDLDKCGYVMEYCQNGNLYPHIHPSLLKISLFDFVRSEQMTNGLILDPIRMIDMASGVADILSILHDSGIAHRDIKCTNIMVWARFQSCHLFLFASTFSNSLSARWRVSSEAGRFWVVATAH